jgi:hypothetical protein
MKARTLITQRLYFGMDALKLRACTGRALARIVGLPRERARISAPNLHQDFDVNTVDGHALIGQLVSAGLLQPAAEREDDYRLTERFFEFAAARVVEPLQRPRAKLLLAAACNLAERINREWAQNPLAIDSFAVYGAYMSREHQIDELCLGIVVQARATPPRARFRRMLTKHDGAEQVRAAFRDLSSFISVRLVTDQRALPRPFAVVFDRTA